MVISLASVSPSGEETRSRVELLPQSSAATLAADITHCQWRKAHGLRDEFAHGVGSASEEVSEVSVETLDADTRSADTTRRLRLVVLQCGFLAASGVGVVGGLEGCLINEGLKTVNPTVSFEPTNGVV